MRPGFGYQSGNSILHSLDPRTKLFGIFLFSVTLVVSSPEIILFAGIMTFGISWISNISIRGIIDDIKPLLFIFFLAGVAQVITYPVVPGLIRGLTVAARFTVIVTLSYLFTATTPPGETRLAVESLLKHIPLINESDWGTMFSTAFRFFPYMFEEMNRVRDAQKSRLGDKGLRRQVYTFVIPFFSRSFRVADTLALAMASRAYSSDRTSIDSIELSRIDYLGSIVVLLLSSLGILYRVGFTM